MTRLLLPCAFVLLGACAQHPPSVTLLDDDLSDCPVKVYTGQTLTVTLPSNPTTGLRWKVTEAAPSVLRSLGPEVYSAPEDAGLVGGAGQSSWRYQVKQAGEGRLLMTYQRPWEADLAPEKTIDCGITAR
ncbi:protease inhibitor I42 family protein [Pseudomonas sp. LRF_L74]|uniref:protease inhibitor I42 family protein n=1 Tax=Pseudomonas sp. LRF_L74 TaxID=3369422 RepID=UPI003F5E1647